jgi:hypothetical protein
MQTDSSLSVDSDRITNLTAGTVSGSTLREFEDE